MIAIMALFGRKPKPQPAFPPTGNPLDDLTMQQLAIHGADFNVPRDWVHYVYCQTDEGAAELETVASAAGWTVRRAATGSGIIANRIDMPVNGHTVPEVRGFFEGLAARVPGGEYDGWEAGL